MKVFPAQGGRVRDPRTRAIITEEGAEVNDSDFYWLTRLAHGDVTKEALTKAPKGEDAPALPAPENSQG